MSELRLAPSGVEARPRVLFFVEGYTDIRFVVGLSEICDLTMAVPARAFEESALKARVAASGARVQVREIAGGRAAFQLRSLAYLWRAVPGFDVVLSQSVVFAKGLELKLAGTNLLGSKKEFIQGGEIQRRFDPGRKVSLSLSYSPL